MKVEFGVFFGRFSLSGEGEGEVQKRYSLRLVGVENRSSQYIALEGGVGLKFGLERFR